MFSNILSEEHYTELSTEMKDHFLKAIDDFLSFSLDFESDRGRKWKTELKNLSKNIDQLVNRENTYLVLYSGFNKEGQDRDYSWACMTYNFRIFRKDGRLIRLEFEFTD